MRWTWVAVLALAAGCDGIELDKLLKQHEPLTRITPEPAGANCAHGGSAVLTGLDLDDDGVLDDTEVRSTAYSCASAMPGVLVLTRYVPPGERCALGGHVSRAGLDVNGNGELEDGEVTREVYSCTEPEAVVTRMSALPSPPGPCHLEGTLVEAGLDLDRNGALDDPERRAMAIVCVAPALVRVRQVAEPASVTCPSGGIRVEAGADDDGDTEFEYAEVGATMAVCNALRTYDGHYVVKSAADLAALEGISRIRGSLQVVGTPLKELVLPALMMVEDQLLIDSNMDLKRVELPSLRFVEQDLRIGFNAALETLAVGSAGNEVWVEKELVIETNPSLATLSGLSPVVPRGSITLRDNDALRFPGTFDSLVELTGSIFISDNDGLLALPFAKLERLGGSLDITRNAALPSLTGTVLTSVSGDVSISDNDTLMDLSGMPQLESIGGNLIVQDNDRLLSLAGMQSLARLGSLRVYRNAELTDAGPFPVLRTITTALDINNNPSLVSVGDFRFLQHLELLHVGNNTRLTSLTGLDTLQTARFLNVDSNNSLTSLGALSRLRALEGLEVTYNLTLKRLDLPALESVTGTFTVVDNPVLPTCQATALATRTFTGIAAQITGNDSTATCD
ncbi:hypothetical protein [Myxococcus sp. RHSTA-1-4]|uniref:DUF7151 family protein n=1 Tax=Myxococcus sp. RHSTA-1-4 TaxID=2874601 RepID=UPI001CBE78BA|nr:hypothetical protein [Myxococcus sp. RHSTA-1-4]MBZ4416058.1 hypothetical protein [Myxococcus sp. RHSTA-1-4]